MNDLRQLNERFGSTNMTAFKLVGSDTTPRTVLTNIEMDISILNSSDMKYKHVYIVILRQNCIDIRSIDNGTPIAYFFCEDAMFEPEVIAEDLKTLCEKLDVKFESRL